MSWARRRVLVTGAGGFIGSHLVEALARQSASVRALVRYTSRADTGLLRLADPGLLRDVEIVTGDLRDADAVRAAVAGTEIVFHLGALIAIPYSYLHPREVVETNVLGTLNVLEAARAAGVASVIHTSTSEVYGTARTVPIDETHPLQARSPYAATKIGADALAHAFWRSFGLPVVTVRPFNTYGPRQSARAVVPTIVTQALTRDEVRLGHLHPTRDLTFVEDTVGGLLAAAGPGQDLRGEVINLGSGMEISVGDLARRILAQVGRTLPIVTDAPRLRPAASEVERLHAGTDRARTRLGWTPAVGLDEGLARTIAWIREHLDLYQPDRYVV